MTISDQDFREAFKPLHIPAAYHPDDTKENKVVFALAQLGKGTAAEVTAKLLELEPDFQDEQTMITAEKILSGLYDKGLLKGAEENGERVYNLSKITEANEGEVEPGLLAPGLD